MQGMKASTLAVLEDKLADLGMKLGVPVGVDGHGLGQDKYATGLSELTKLQMERLVFIFHSHPFFQFTL